MKRRKEDDTELYVIAFKELINEVVSSLSREEAINYITREVCPRYKPSSSRYESSTDKRSS